MQVMTTGQRVSLEYHGNGYNFTVNQVAIEAQEESDNTDRGMISADTYIVFEAPSSTGIKVCFVYFCLFIVILYFEFASEK